MFARMLRGKVKPGMWDDYERYYNETVGVRGQVLLHSIAVALGAFLPPHGLGKIRVGLAWLFKLKMTQKSQQRFAEPAM